MATVVRLIRKLGGLGPADAESEEALQAIPLGVEVKGEITIPVNAPFRRKFFALLDVIYPHVRDTWPIRDDFREEVLKALGFCRMVRAVDGTTYAKALSMKWHKMKEPEYRALYERFISLCATKILPGIDRDDVRREFEEIEAGYKNNLSSLETHVKGDGERGAGVTLKSAKLSADSKAGGAPAPQMVGRSP
jgi:hypothetical protein